MAAECRPHPRSVVVRPPIRAHASRRPDPAIGVDPGPVAALLELGLEILELSGKTPGGKLDGQPGFQVIAPAVEGVLGPGHEPHRPAGKAALGDGDTLLALEP